MTKPRIGDQFKGPTLDDGTWVDHYLPQWTTPDRSAARYDFDLDGLRLRIDADQPAWRTADGLMRVSNIQTGLFSGPRGSQIGTHRHRLAGLEVVTEQPTRRLWTAIGGEVTVRASASVDPSCMLGIWLVGFEESGPEDSGELCIAELFGHKLAATSSTVRVGSRPTTTLASSTTSATWCSPSTARFRTRTACDGTTSSSCSPSRTRRAQHRHTLGP